VPDSPLLDLERELLAAAERRALDPVVAQRRLRRWRPLVLIAAALVLSGSATAAVVSLLGTRSKPLDGSVSHVPGTSGKQFHYSLPVTPDLDAGHTGWCSFPFVWTGRRPSAGSGGGFCVPSGGGGSPVILAAGGMNVSLFWMVVQSRVAAVRLPKRKVIIPRSDPRLPADWRAVVSFTEGPISATLFDSRGRVIPQPSQRSPAPVATRADNPDRPPRSRCWIRAPRLPGLTRQWSVVATAVPARGAAVSARALFSCARSWFMFNGRSPAVWAAVLVGARDPRRFAPDLPGLRPTGQPGTYVEAGGTAGDITARRVGRAWLVVQGGAPQSRAMLLRALRAGA
jgi:hypothetical protein